MNLWDTHMHTAFSGDCDIPPEVMLNTAKEKGLSGIIFTDHLDWDYPNEPGRFDLELDDYFLYMGKLAEIEAKNPPAIKQTEFRVGVELGLQTHLKERHEKLLAELPFDYVIGSIHVVHGKDPYFASYFEGRTAKEAYTEYFKCMLENLKIFYDIDSLGHLDYVVRYGMRHLGKEAGTCHYADYADLIDEIFRFLIDHDIALEVNTGSYRCDMTEPNPSFELLRRYRELGGEKITIGADAHHTEHVGLHFEALPTELKNLGFTHYLIHKNRTPQKLPL